MGQAKSLEKSNETVLTRSKSASTVVHPSRKMIGRTHKKKKNGRDEIRLGMESSPVITRTTTRKLNGTTHVKSSKKIPSLAEKRVKSLDSPGYDWSINERDRTNNDSRRPSRSSTSSSIRKQKMKGYHHKSLRIAVNVPSPAPHGMMSGSPGSTSPIESDSRIHRITGTHGAGKRMSLGNNAMIHGSGTTIYGHSPMPTHTPAHSGSGYGCPSMNYPNHHHASQSHSLCGAFYTPDMTVSNTSVESTPTPAGTGSLGPRRSVTGNHSRQSMTFIPPPSYPMHIQTPVKHLTPKMNHQISPAQTPLTQSKVSQFQLDTSRKNSVIEKNGAIPVVSSVNNDRSRQSMDHREGFPSNPSPSKKNHKKTPSKPVSGEPSPSSSSSHHPPKKRSRKNSLNAPVVIESATAPKVLVDVKSWIPIQNQVESISTIFKKIKSLGGGPYSTVYEAINLRDGLKYALKQVPFGEWADLLFTNEVKFMSRLDHPGITNILDYFMDSNGYYLVTTLAETDLFQEIRKNKRINEVKTARIMKALLETLAYMHKKDVVHRDIKPSNIVCRSSKTKLDEDGNEQIDLEEDPMPSFIDFGEAMRIKDSQVYSEFVGTPNYLSPTRWRKHNGWQLKSSDIWSMGVTTFEMLCGTNCFSGDRDTLKKKISRGYWKFPRSANISDLAMNFIRCLLEIKPHHRPSAKTALKHPWILLYGGDHTNFLQINSLNDFEYNRLIERQYSHMDLIFKSYHDIYREKKRCLRRIENFEKRFMAPDAGAVAVSSGEFKKNHEKKNKRDDIQEYPLNKPGYYAVQPIGEPGNSAGGVGSKKHRPFSMGHSH